MPYSKDPMGPVVVTSIRVPVKIYEQIRLIAQRGDRSINMQLLRYIRQGLEREKEEDYRGPG